MSSSGTQAPGQVGLPRSYQALPQVGRDANVPPPQARPQALPIEYFDSALIQNTLYIHDTQYWLAIPPANGSDAWDGASPVIHFDPTDYFVFNRAADELDLYLDGAKALAVNPAGVTVGGALAASGGLTIGGSASIGGDTAITGMVTAGNGFQLDPGAWWHISAGGGPIQYWDTDSAVFFWRGGKTWQWSVGGVQIAALNPNGLNLQGGTLTAGSLALPNQTAKTVFAAPAAAAGPPSFRQLTQADITGAGTVTSVGLVMPADFAVAGSPVTAAGNITVTRNSQAQNLVSASPNGAPGVPTFRALVGADLPNPAAAALGGVRSLAAVANQFLTSISTAGQPVAAQPSTVNLSDRDAAATAFTPTVSVTTLGDGVFSAVATSGQYRRLGFLVWFWINVRFTLTYTTATGGLSVAGWGLAPAPSNGGYFPGYITPTPTAPGAGPTFLATMLNGNLVFEVNGNNYVGNSWGPGLYGLVSGTQYTLHAGGVYATNAP